MVLNICLLPLNSFSFDSHCLHYKHQQPKINMVKLWNGAANKSNSLPCFVNISTTNRNFYKKIYTAISHLYLRVTAELY